MKLKIAECYRIAGTSKSDDIKIVRSLGYPIIFVKTDLFDTVGPYQAIRTELQDAFLTPLEYGGLSEADGKRLVAATNEYALLLSGMLCGYLCYPAYNYYVGRKPYNCGPMYVKEIDLILKQYDEKVSRKFNKLCAAITDQIADYLDQCRKMAEEKDAEDKKLKETVAKLGRMDIVYDRGAVYFKLKVVRSFPINTIVDFLAEKTGLSKGLISIQYGWPLNNGKVQLNLPKEVLNVESEYWDTLAKVTGRAAVKKAREASNAFFKVLNAPAKPPAPPEKPKLQIAIEKLGRKDITYEYGRAYLQLPRIPRWAKGKNPIVVPENIDNFLFHRTSQTVPALWHRFTCPIQMGKVLLIVPEDRKSGDSWPSELWTILRREPDLLQTVKEAYRALHRVLDELPDAKEEGFERAAYFQLDRIPKGKILEKINDLWLKDVPGFDKDSVWRDVIRPLQHGQVYLINDLPEISKNFGPAYFKALRAWMTPSEWRRFTAELKEHNVEVGNLDEKP